MSISDLAKNLERFTIAKSPAILTAVAVTGAVTATILAGKASFKAAKLIAEEEERREHEHSVREVLTNEEPEILVPMDTNEKINLVWTLYIPAAGTCVTTVMAMIAANQIGTRRTAAMAAAYSLSEKAFGEYREKIVEKIGEKKEGEARDEIAQARVDRNPVDSQQVIMLTENKVLCYDQHSGRYFQSDMETLKKAQNDTNYRIINDSHASLNDFYERVGLELIQTGEELGWTTTRPLDLAFHAVMAVDQRPCIAIEFVHSPVPNYYKGH